MQVKGFPFAEVARLRSSAFYAADKPLAATIDGVTYRTSERLLPSMRHTLQAWLRSKGLAWRGTIKVTPSKLKELLA